MYSFCVARGLKTTNMSTDASLISSTNQANVSLNKWFKCLTWLIILQKLSIDD